MADYTTIDNPGLFFNTVLYTGNGSTGHGITGVGFQPDWIWIKERGASGFHVLTDAVRGKTKQVYSNDNQSENTNSSVVTAFDSDGFTLGDRTEVNNNSDTYVAWNWLASNTTASNTDGSITSTVSANTTAGFSILTFTGTGSSATVGHGLGAVPKMILFKKTSGAQGWGVYHAGVGNTGALRLDGTDATDTTSNYFNNTSPTSSVFTVNTNNSVNNSGGTMLAYCFTGKQGYSKFGKFTGNGNADGPFVYTGFKPAWVMLKETSGTSDWSMYDNKREPFNVADSTLEANTSDAEAAVSGRPIDILSNGFKLRGDSSFTNENGATYIYMAFAENPFVTAGTKAAGTAR